MIRISIRVWIQDFACCTGIQNRAAPYYLGVHKFTPILALRGELGWHSVYIDRWVSVCRYWNRLVGMDTDRLTYQVFLWDLNRSNIHKIWCSDIRDIFQSVDMDNVFYSKEQCDISLVKDRLLEIDLHNQRYEGQNKPKLRTYIQFKSEIDTEEYVSSFLPKGCRSLHAKLRCGILPLRIKTGRYDGVALENRSCEFCSENVLEDEYHFMCSCDLYDDLCDSLYAYVISVYPQFQDLTSNEKLIHVMKNCQIPATKYAKAAFVRHRKILYQ